MKNKMTITQNPSHGFLVQIRNWTIFIKVLQVILVILHHHNRLKILKAINRMTKNQWILLIRILNLLINFSQNNKNRILRTNKTNIQWHFENLRINPCHPPADAHHQGMYYEGAAAVLLPIKIDWRSHVVVFYPYLHGRRGRRRQLQTSAVHRLGRR